ncbi:MAG: sulfocyanin-like copper-binding protein [Gemmatimonadota bacterium]
MRSLLAAILVFAPGALVAQAPSLPEWIQSDPAQRTVMLKLVVTRPAGSPSALINGYHSGGVQIVVPAGWTVKWEWLNADSSGPHSLVVGPEREKIPEQAGKPAFQNALTRSALAGLPAGQRDVTTFEADQAGWYWLYDGVPGEALKGAWIGLKVDPAAKEPSVVIKPPA